AGTFIGPLVGMAPRTGFSMETGGWVVRRSGIMTTGTKTPILNIASLGGFHPGNLHLAVAGIEDRLRRQLRQSRLGRTLIFILTLHELPFRAIIRIAFVDTEDHRMQSSPFFRKGVIGQ